MMAGQHRPSLAPRIEYKTLTVHSFFLAFLFLFFSFFFQFFASAAGRRCYLDYTQAYIHLEKNAKVMGL
jgi:hypothetical protein